MTESRSSRWGRNTTKEARRRKRGRSVLGRTSVFAFGFCGTGEVEVEEDVSIPILPGEESWGRVGAVGCWSAAHTVHGADDSGRAVGDHGQVSVQLDATPLLSPETGTVRDSNPLAVRHSLSSEAALQNGGTR